jgi:hypothetical protein
MGLKGQNAMLKALVQLRTPVHADKLRRGAGRAGGRDDGLDKLRL